MSTRKKWAEEFRSRVQNRIDNSEISLDSKKGCLWCYGPREPGSQYCCEDHKKKYEWYNGKPTEKEET